MTRAPWGNLGLCISKRRHWCIFHHQHVSDERFKRVHVQMSSLGRILIYVQQQRSRVMAFHIYSFDRE